MEEYNNFHGTLNVLIDKLVHPLSITRDNQDFTKKLDLCYNVASINPLASP